jgi:hypothetical protein
VIGQGTNFWGGKKLTQNTQNAQGLNGTGDEEKRRLHHLKGYTMKAEDK